MLKTFEKLIDKCKCGVYVNINSHKDSYETVSEYFNSDSLNKAEKEEIKEGIYFKMQQMDTIIEVQFYPNTPITFYKVYHYDLETAISEALIIANQAVFDNEQFKKEMYKLNK